MLEKNDPRVQELCLFDVLTMDILQCGLVDNLRWMNELRSIVCVMYA